jgi:hypothetical protein
MCVHVVMGASECELGRGITYNDMIIARILVLSVYVYMYVSCLSAIMSVRCLFYVCVYNSVAGLVVH